jgi:uncharacterized protein YqjF (DUF2071 family)
MRQHTFDYGFLARTAHRPWPLPDKPWIMTQSWHDLLFAHWPVDRASLRARVPREFELDEYQGQTWIGIIPFHMTNVAPRGVPALPWVSAFPELNVRTYVTVDGKPGVYFFSLDAGNPVAVATARTLFHLPYFSASMDVVSKDPWIEYRSQRNTAANSNAEFVGSYRATGAPRAPQPGTLEHFLTERYCLYTLDGSARAYRVEIHHEPWSLQPAELDATVNTMTDASGITLPPVAPLLHFSKHQDVVTWSLERLQRA